MLFLREIHYFIAGSQLFADYFQGISETAGLNVDNCSILATVNANIDLWRYHSIQKLVKTRIFYSSFIFNLISSSKFPNSNFQKYTTEELPFCIEVCLIRVVNHFSIRERNFRRYFISSVLNLWNCMGNSNVHITENIYMKERCCFL